MSLRSLWAIRVSMPVNFAGSYSQQRSCSQSGEAFLAMVSKLQDLVCRLRKARSATDQRGSGACGHFFLPMRYSLGWSGQVGHLRSQREFAEKMGLRKVSGPQCKDCCREFVLFDSEDVYVEYAWSSGVVGHVFPSS